MAEIEWYFDFISPYAYLQFCQLERLSDKISVRYRPILFAGLLDHWGHKGPAEIPGKRVYTFRQAQWLADRDGMPYRMPPNHPFNPLQALRLAIALGSKSAAIGQIFKAIWADGHLPDNPTGWNSISKAVGVDDASALISDQKVKDELHENGKRAIEANVFGVPTAALNGALFWGQDSTDFLLDYINNPALFDNSEMRRIETTQPSAVRSVGR
ncbi:MAG TPA: 2-hydroxychromene-2-carboxylate isomerase [Sneathiellales bacterium]|jgi:2-hydroxychromene-2-carboxylate isomerase|nr:2-hydroxychromene-2-carboxylate isomerase [Sneathiellales bacterium]